MVKDILISSKGNTVTVDSRLLLDFPEFNEPIKNEIRRTAFGVWFAENR